MPRLPHDGLRRRKRLMNKRLPSRRLTTHRDRHVMRRPEHVPDLDRVFFPARLRLWISMKTHPSSPSFASFSPQALHLVIVRRRGCICMIVSNVSPNDGLLTVQKFISIQEEWMSLSLQRMGRKRMNCGSQSQAMSQAQ